MNAPGAAKDPSCLDDFDPSSLSVPEALERILSGIVPVREHETVPLREALSRVLAAGIVSEINVPSGTNSAMDGYAMRSEDIPPHGARELSVIGTSWAGRPMDGALKPGTCARIMTGAILPEGADTVVIQEQVVRDGNVIRIEGNIRAGDNVRRAGEDIGAGDTVLGPGQRLTPADIGLIASLGIGNVQVWRRPRVAFFSTGDELRSIGETLEPGEIYDSNRYTLHAMLTRLGAEIRDLGVVRDDPQATEQAFREAARDADAVITSGGVSVGEADYVKETLQRVGEVQFWKVAMKPGRPLAFGRIGTALFFGLPGNPVSVMVTFYQFVQPALRRLAGEPEPAMTTMRVTCTSRLRKRPGRVEFQRGLLETGDDGRPVVRKTGAQGSGILRSMSRGNCFIVLPMDSTGVEPGEIVEVQPFYGLV